MPDAIIIYCSIDSKKAGQELAHQLVKEKIAACVQIQGPMTSVYQWEEKIQEDQEYLLAIKTKKSSYAQVESFIKDNHPYETPEIIAVPIEMGSLAYLKWLDHSVVST